MEHQRNDHNQTVIFVDTDAFVASIKADDPNHVRAQTLFEKLKTHPIRFLTSNYVFSETVTVLSQRVSHRVAADYIDTVREEASPFTIKRADEAIEKAAIEIFKEQTSKNTSYVDCTNMAFMQFTPMSAIFSFDKIYKKNGFSLAEELIFGM